MPKNICVYIFIDTAVLEFLQDFFKSSVHVMRSLLSL